jgi:TolB-like protein
MTSAAAACALILLSFAPAQDEAAEEPTPTPEAPVEKTKIVVLELEASGIESAQAELVGGVVAQTLSRFDTLEVVTTDDIRRVADFEAQKQALGCDQESCLAEIAGAMGAQYVIFGRLGALEESLLVQLNLFDAGAARPVAREDLRGKSLDELVDRMGPATTRLARTLLPEGAVIEVEDETPTATTGSAEGPGALTLGLRWGGAGLGALGLAVGTVATTIALIEVGVVSDTAQPAKARNDGKLVGAAMVITAGASGVVAVLGLGAFGVSFILE